MNGEGARERTHAHHLEADSKLTGLALCMSPTLPAERR